jgi:hypothetical protein
MPNQLKNKRVLFCYHTQIDYMAAPVFSEQQVLCGPFVPDGVGANGWPTLNAAHFDVRNLQYDIVEVVKSLPDHQKPEVLIVRADAFQANFPRNIGQLGIPSILILGDTQHGPHTDVFDPIRTLLRYAQSEPYDFYISDHTRHHLHFFIEAGLKNVHWLPALGVLEWGLTPQTEWTYPLSFIGNTSYHPARLQSLHALHQAGVPITHAKTDQKNTAIAMNRSLTTFNHSLNGDINLRTFEACFAGTCLLTDRLRPQSGFDLLFEADRHMVTYGSDQELVERAQALLNAPQRASQIGKAAYQEVMRAHHPTLKRDQLSALIYGSDFPALYRGDAEPRGRFDPKVPLLSLLNRIANYELLQEWHRLSKQLTILAMPDSDPKLAQDLVDLPRLSVLWRDHQAPDLFTTSGVAAQITLAPKAEGAAASLVLAGSPKDVTALGSSLPPFILLTRRATTTLKQALDERGFSAPHATYPNLYCLGAGFPPLMRHQTTGHAQV